MKLGAQLPAFSTDSNLLPAEAIRGWAERAENIGFESLWAIDHLVKPHTYESSVLDPIVALTYAAAVTDTVELGTGIVVLPLRRTAAAAKRVLSLQHLAGRQVHLGVGAGYNRPEFEVSGVPRNERGPRLSEGIDVLQALFSNEPVSYDGQFHSFSDIHMDPDVDPEPRILAAGGAKTDDDGNQYIIPPVLDRIFKAHGWVAQPTNPEKVGTEIDLIEQHARERNIDPESIEKVVVTYAHLVDGEDVADEQRRVFQGLFGPKGYERAAEHLLVGTLDEIREQIESYEQAGVDRLIIGPPSTDPTDYPAQLDLFADEILSYR